MLSLVAISLAFWAGWRPVERLGASWPWDGADLLLKRMIFLLAAAVPTWLAFVVIGTRSDVKLFDHAWWKIGWKPWVVFASLMVVHVVAFSYAPHDAIIEHAEVYYSFYRDEHTGIDWGWLIAGTITAALAEELVFRGLLQRALEGYIRDNYALVVQAIVFHLIHVHVYGVGAAGGVHVIAGIVFGMAFMRTRCLLAPLVLHAGGNLFLAALYVGALE